MRRATQLHQEASFLSFSYADHRRTNAVGETGAARRNRRHGSDRAVEVNEDIGLQTTGPPHRHTIDEGRGDHIGRCSRRLPSSSERSSSPTGCLERRAGITIGAGTVAAHQGPALKRPKAPANPTFRAGGLSLLGDLNNNPRTMLLLWKKCSIHGGRMADASLAAMTPVTAVDHERISKICPERSQIW